MSTKEDRDLYLKIVIPSAVAVFALVIIIFVVRMWLVARSRRDFKKVVSQAEDYAEQRRMQLPIEDPESQYGRNSYYDPPPPAYQGHETRQKPMPYDQSTFANRL